MRRLIVDDLKTTRIIYGNTVADFLGIVYLVTNDVTNEVYVGQTMNGLSERWRHHCSQENSTLFSVVAKYGSANFTLSILTVCYSVDSLNQSEIKWLNHYKKTHKVYNIQEGGTNAPKTEAQKVHLSSVQSGKVYTLKPKPIKTLRKTNSLRGIQSQKSVIGVHLDTKETIELKSMSCDSRFDPRLISACCKGKRRSHRRFAWSYKNA